MSQVVVGDDLVATKRVSGLRSVSFRARVYRIASVGEIPVAMARVTEPGHIGPRRGERVVLTEGHIHSVERRAAYMVLAGRRDGYADV